MGRILGIDSGTKRIGLALSDPTGFLASPLKLVEAGKTPKETAQRILDAASEKGPLDKIVMGLPLHLSGEESPSSKLARDLGNELESLSNLPVIYWDERLTTAQVERTLKEANMSRKKRTQHLDLLAAQAILQNYLDSPMKEQR